MELMSDENSVQSYGAEEFEVSFCNALNNNGL